jgi:hypothetical protein
MTPDARRVLYHDAARLQCLSTTLQEHHDQQVEVTRRTQRTIQRQIGNAVRQHAQTLVMSHHHPRARIIFLGLDRGCKIAVAQTIAHAREEYGLERNLLAFVRGGSNHPEQPSSSSSSSSVPADPPSSHSVLGLETFWRDVVPTLTQYDLVLTCHIRNYSSRARALTSSSTAVSRATLLDGSLVDTVESSNQILLMLRAIKRTGAQTRLLTFQPHHPRGLGGSLAQAIPEANIELFSAHPSFEAQFHAIHRTELDRPPQPATTHHSSSSSWVDSALAHQQKDQAMKMLASVTLTRLLQVVTAFALPHAFLRERLIPIPRSIVDSASFDRAVEFLTSSCTSILRSTAGGPGVNVYVRQMLQRAILRADYSTPLDGSSSSLLLPAILARLRLDARDAHIRRRVNPIALALLLVLITPSRSQQQPNLAVGVHLLLQCGHSITRATQRWRQQDREELLRGEITPLLTDDTEMPPLADVAVARISSNNFPLHPPLPAHPPVHQSTLALILRCLTRKEFILAARTCHGWLSVCEQPVSRPYEFDHAMSNPTAPSQLEQMVQNRLYRQVRSLKLTFAQEDWTLTIQQLAVLPHLAYLEIQEMGDVADSGAGVLLTSFKKVAQHGRLQTLVIGFEQNHPGLKDNVKALHAALPELTCLRHLLYLRAPIGDAPARAHWDPNCFDFLERMTQLESLTLSPTIAFFAPLARAISQMPSLQRLHWDVGSQLEDSDLDLLLGDGALYASVEEFRGRPAEVPSPFRPHRLHSLREFQLVLGAVGSLQTTSGVAFELLTTLPKLQSLRLIIDYVGQLRFLVPRPSPSQSDLMECASQMVPEDFSLDRLAARCQNLRELTLVIPRYHATELQRSDQGPRLSFGSSSTTTTRMEYFPPSPVFSSPNAIIRLLASAKFTRLEKLRIDAEQGWELDDALTTELAESGLVPHCVISSSSERRCRRSLSCSDSHRFGCCTCPSVTHSQWRHRSKHPPRLRPPPSPDRPQRHPLALASAPAKHRRRLSRNRNSWRRRAGSPRRL